MLKLKRNTRLSKKSRDSARKRALRSHQQLSAVEDQHSTDDHQESAQGNNQLQEPAQGNNQLQEPAQGNSQQQEPAQEESAQGNNQEAGQGNNQEAAQGNNQEPAQGESAQGINHEAAQGNNQEPESTRAGTRYWRTSTSILWNSSTASLLRDSLHMCSPSRSTPA